MSHRQCPECSHIASDFEFLEVSEPQPYIPPAKLPGQALSWHEQEIENGDKAIARIKQVVAERGCSLKDAMDIVRGEGMIK